MKGIMISIREADEADAKPLIELRKQLLEETQFLLLEPSEYNPTVELEANFIREFRNAGNSSIFLAVNNDAKLVGFMGVAGGTTKRTQHKATVFLGVLRDYWRMGIGKQLFHQLLKWAKKTQLRRIELTTAVTNERAYSLYKAVGFEVECIKKQNIFVDGKPIDEYQMALLLPDLNRGI
jgi:RimJ/RimL family protein N-acetyltransferase